MTDIYDLQPQMTPAYVQLTLNDWSQAVARWNTYRTYRKQGIANWKAISSIAETEGMTGEGIRQSIARVKTQLILEHPELSDEGEVIHHNV